MTTVLVLVVVVLILYVIGWSALRDREIGREVKNIDAEWEEMNNEPPV